MRKVIVINAKIAQIGEDFEILCVLNASQEVEKYTETLAKQLSEFCDDNDVTVTEEEVKAIAEALSWSDYAETPNGELIFTAGTYTTL